MKLDPDLGEIESQSHLHKGMQLIEGSNDMDPEPIFQKDTLI